MRSKGGKQTIYSFLWGNKPDKLRRDIITRDIKAGGLKMVDVETMIYSLKVKWAKNVLQIIIIN